jgi:glycosyltransferase involved in cell wall biosynthesis
MSRKKLLVRGPALSRSGYGEQCRFALRSLRAYENIFDIYLLVTNWGHTGWIIEDNEERRWLDDLAKKTAFYQQQKPPVYTGYDISLQVTIPNEWEKMAPLNIGYTAGIEATKVAPVTNEQTGEVINDFRCEVPITVCNYPVKHFEAANVNLDFETDFNYLIVAQWGPRKNVKNAVKWFLEEYKDEPNVGLVLKVNTVNNSFMDKFNTKNSIESLFSEHKDRKCKIYLIHGAMTDEEMTALYQHPKIKCVVSLAHGEGFGLPLFEAAYNEVPVLAPAWSGYCDFMYAPVKNKKGKVKNKALFARVDYTLAPIQKNAIWPGVLNADMLWCYPEKNSYKVKLREMYRDYSRFKSQAKILKNHIEKNFVAERQYKIFAEAVIGTDTEIAAAMSNEQVFVL